MIKQTLSVDASSIIIDDDCALAKVRSNVSSVGIIIDDATSQKSIHI